MTVRSGWLLNASEATPGQSRNDTRLVPTGTMVPAGALSTRPGLIPGNNPCNLTGSVMSGTLSVGRAIVAGTSSQGAYPVAVTVAEAITVPNGDASNPRIDSVFLIVYDKLFDTSGNTLAQVQYVTGTPAGSPTAPSAPATTNSALRLWDILVPAGASAGSPINWATALTDRRPYTSAVGGINPDGSTAGWYSGQYRDGGTTTGIERYNGSSWESRVYLGTSGRVVIGSDVEFYRDSANVARTPDSLTVDGNLSVGGIGQILFARKTSDTTRASTTTTTADPELTVSGLVSGGVYRLAGLLMYGARDDTDLKFGWAAPASSTFAWHGHCQATTTTGTTGSAIYDVQSISTTNYAPGGATTNNTTIMACVLNGLLTAGAAGTFVLNWAQNTSNATGTVLKKDSWFELRRVA